MLFTKINKIFSPPPKKKKKCHRSLQLSNMSLVVGGLCVQHVPVSANIAGPGQTGFIVSSDLFWWADRIPMQLGNGLQNTQMHSACTGPGPAWDRRPVSGSSATLNAEYFSVGYLVAVSAKK